MKTEDLKAQGLTDEQVNFVMKQYGDDLKTFKTENAKLKDDLEIQKGVLAERNSEIAELKKVDVEALKTAEYERGKAEGSAEITEFKKKNALEKALSGYKAKDVSIISNMLDMSKIEFNDKFEIVKGLDEQINPIKESHDYLFESDKRTPKFADKTPGTETDTPLTKDQFAKLSYSQRLALKEKDPDAYEKLKN